MSETDSDLDFQSADEDTSENDTSENANVAATVEVVETISEASVPSNSEEKIRNSLSTTIIEKTSNVSNKNDGLEDTKITPEINESIESKSTNKNGEKLESVDSLPETEVLVEELKPKQESQRIPLRLEKKIQQKSQLSKESSPENVEENIDSSNLHSTENNKEKSYSWGFSSWGSSLLSTAASSVSSFSSQVSQGIGTVMETVESTLGAPSPEELASALKDKKGEKSDVDIESESKEEETLSSGILSDVSAWTKVLESTGSKVLMGGLDTLELIGKKTMDIITEGDPGLRNKRRAFTDGVNLSQILREAKEKADEQGEKNNLQSPDIIHYSQVFDDQQGLVHLEALEMLSKQTQAKFQRLLMRYTKKAEIKKRLEEIKSICENIPPLDDPSECEEFEDFESVFKKHALELSLPLNVDNIVKTQRKLNDAVIKYENVSEEPYISPDEIYQSSICSLAEFTARCIETFHKVAELILVQSNLGPEVEKCATNLTGLTTVMCVEINNLSNKFHRCLESSSKHFPNYVNSQDLNNTALITNLYVEASNSNKYIQDAFQMLVPVLQCCLLESLDE